MIVIDLLVEDPRWDEVGLATMAQVAFDATAERLGMTHGFEVSLMGCDDTRIMELNTEFRDKPLATNVLSWPSDERGSVHPGGAPFLPELVETEDASLGDIAIAYDTCAREAQIDGTTLADHTTHLLVHGMLHLLGYDHENDQDAALMEGLETQILAKLGIADPYYI